MACKETDGWMTGEPAPLPEGGCPHLRVNAEFERVGGCVTEIGDRCVDCGALVPLPAPLPEGGEELKPCPFCGGEASIIAVEEESNAGGYVVMCSGCECSTRVWFPIKDDVRGILRSEWNKRKSASRPDLHAVRERIEQRIRVYDAEPPLGPIGDAFRNGRIAGLQEALTLLPAEKGTE